MRKLLEVNGKSQYSTDIETRFQSSACGPVTAFVILNYLFPKENSFKVNELYRKLGSTRIGLFKWRFIRKVKKLLQLNWNVQSCTVQEMKKQLDENRPVAAKFDKWFTFRWNGNFEFDYHWVPVIGYEEKEDDLILIIHDNGGQNRDSRIRHVSYTKNHSIISFVKIEPQQPK